VAQDDASSAVRCQLAKEAGASAFLHFRGKLPHRLLGDSEAFATREGSFGIVERHKKLRALPFTVFPQGKGLLNGVLFGVKPSAFNRTLGESLLI
jgi:hypothetical protein